MSRCHLPSSHAQPPEPRASQPSSVHHPIFASSHTNCPTKAYAGCSLSNDGGSVRSTTAARLATDVPLPSDAISARRPGPFFFYSFFFKNALEAPRFERAGLGLSAEQKKGRSRLHMQMGNKKKKKNWGQARHAHPTTHVPAVNPKWVSRAREIKGATRAGRLANSRNEATLYPPQCELQRRAVRNDRFQSCPVVTTEAGKRSDRINRRRSE